MFDIGFSELLLIAVVALVVLGPERLPRAAKFAGLWVRRARAQWYSVKSEFEREIAADELRRSMDQARASMQEAEAAVRETRAGIERDAAGLERAARQGPGDGAAGQRPDPPAEDPRPDAPPEGDPDPFEPPLHDPDPGTPAPDEPGHPAPVREPDPPRAPREAP